MPIATPEVYNEMLNRARDGKFAYPAINVTSSQTLSAALRGFADAESDGIIQVSVGGAEYWSGSTVKDRIAGSLAMAAYAREVAKNYDVTIALHTDHCAKQNLDSWTEQLMHMEAEEVKAGRLPWFQSHMWDGSAIPLDENLEIAKRLLQLAVDSHTVLEIEVAIGAGIPKRVVVARNVLRNALITPVTVLGLRIGYLMGGAVVIEIIFAIDGMGKLVLLQGIQQNWVTLVQGGALVVAITFIIVNIIVDMLYLLINPRIRSV